MQMFDHCKLQVPHKTWAGDDRERQNYEAIEQWSYGLADCFGGCSCHTEFSEVSQSIPTDTPTVISRPTPSTRVLCGTPDYTHMLLTHVSVLWTGNTTGEREMQIIYVGTNTGTGWGQTTRGCLGNGNIQVMSASRMIPNRVFGGGGTYQVYLWQSSGINLNATVRFDEYFPCCSCDWDYPGC